MFTGIITHLGTIKHKTINTLQISTEKELIDKLTIGTSISVNGICLTVTKVQDGFSIEYMPETAQKTNIQHFSKGDLVNLELPVTTETMFAGHIVQGHVDTMGTITDISTNGNSHIFTFMLPASYKKYIVAKGSIAINGISLTVIDVSTNSFTVGIIPHTWEHTMLHTVKIGTYVNIEVDILAKYLESLTIQNTQ